MTETAPVPSGAGHRVARPWRAIGLLAATACSIVVLATVRGWSRDSDLPLPAADAPVGHFRVVEGDTVYDDKTRLTWQRAVPRGLFRWSEAGEYCARRTGLRGDGWRLPSAKELLTLVNESRTMPAIDTQAFPETPIDRGYWTSSHFIAYDEGVFPEFRRAVTVRFADGETAEERTVGDDSWWGTPPWHRFHVRCVR